MKHAMLLLVVFTGASCGDDDAPTSPSGSSVSFFVTSTTSVTGNLGGLAGADALSTPRSGCGAGRAPWRAYLSVERDPGNGEPADSREGSDRRGSWINANGATLASSVAELHARTGDASVFVDERGQRINGQWTGSPAPVEHDILRARTQMARWRRVDVRGLDVASAGWQRRSDILTGWGRTRARPAHCRRGTRRTPTRTARTPRHAAVPTASTASLASRGVLTMKAGPQTRP